MTSFIILSISFKKDFGRILYAKKLFVYKIMTNEKPKVIFSIFHQRVIIKERLGKVIVDLGIYKSEIFTSIL